MYRRMLRQCASSLSVSSSPSSVRLTKLPNSNDLFLRFRPSSTHLTARSPSLSTRRSFSSSYISRFPADGSKNKEGLTTGKSEDKDGKGNEKAESSEGKEGSSEFEEKLQRGFRDRANIGPFSYRAIGLFVLTAVGLFFYFQSEKKKIEEKKKKDLATSRVGRPKIGGPFSLVDQEGRTFTHEHLLGRFALVYFGFTHCPDICPEELDKMGGVVDHIIKEHGDATILPVFITCDPARDSPQTIKDYLKDFHPKLIGLTGSYNDIKSTCKAYRVYFSTPPDMKPGDDYLVDHSIFFYLHAPNGQFIDAFGRSFTKEEVSKKVDGYIKEWKAGKRWKENEE